MVITETFIKDLYLIDYPSFLDKRGEFVKTIHSKTFELNNIEYKFEESFYSISNKNVVRGMHFQNPPDDHEKLVYLISGRIIDVVLDLRTKSKTFGKFFHTELSSEKRQGIFIGKGLAHGFLSLEEKSIVEYHTTNVQSVQNESGIFYDSFGFDWNVKDPLISNRDMSFLPFKIFSSPF